MIKPTIGRQVWFWRSGATLPADDITLADQPEAATVCYVHSDRMVNLQVIDHAGAARAETSVVLKQGDEDPRLVWVLPYAEWMPYQKSQAAKTEPFEKAANAAVADQR